MGTTSTNTQRGTVGETLRQFVPYGETCAGFARMFSGDLEGHAPSWPCTPRERTRRSASLHNTIWLRLLAALGLLAGMCFLVMVTPGVANSQTDDFIWDRPAAQGNGNWSASTNWSGPSGRFPDDPDERAVFNNPANMGMPIQNASMPNGLGQLVFNYTGWTVYVEDALRFNSVSYFSYNAIYCYATGGAGAITLYPQIELLGASQNIYTASGATLVLASPSSGFIGSYGPTISSVNPTAEDTGAVRLDVGSTCTGPFYLRQGTLLIRHNDALGQSTATVNIGGDQWVTNGANARLLADASGITVPKNIRVRSYPDRNVNATIGGNHATGSSTFSGSVTLDLSANLTAAGSSTVTFSNQITGVGGITKTGPGTVVLAAANNYQGPTNVQAGTLRTAASGALPSTTAVTMANVSGALLDLAGYWQTIASLDGGGAVGGNVALGSAQLTVGGGSFVGAISGTGGSLRKVGSDTLTLSGTNTYTGATIIEGGTLRAGSTGALPSATSVTLANAAGVLLDLGGYSQTIAALSGGGPSGGNVALGGRTLTVGSGSFAGSLYGTGGSLWKVGSGTLTLYGTNTYTGATIIDGGTLRTGADGALPAATAVTLANSSGALLDLDGYSQTIATLYGGGAAGGNIALGSATLTVGSGNFAGAISGSGGSLRKVGSGTLTLSGTHTYTGGTIIDGGTLRTGAAGALPAATTITLADVAGALLDLNGYSQNVAAVVGGGANGGDIALGSAVLTVGSGNFAGAISGSGGSLRKVGSGTLTLSGTNTYTGSTIIDGGTLRTGAVGALPVATNVTLANAIGTLLDLDGYSQMIGNLSGGGTAGGNITLGSATLTIGSGSFAGAISGAGGALRKVGPGTLALDGSNSYTGPTVISDGTLLVNGVHDKAGPYTVGSGGTLGGTGTVHGNVTVGPEGYLSPGRSVGRFLVFGDVGLEGTLLIDIQSLPVPGCDLLGVEGALDITMATVEFRTKGALSEPPYVFASYRALIGDQFAQVVNLPDGYWVDYNFQGSNQIALVPEPATITLLGVAGVVVLVGRLGRRRRTR